MTDDDQIGFLSVISDAHAFWKKDFSKFAGMVWWNAMKPYDLDAVIDALGRYAVNPDEGHFAPMPADIVKMLQGSTQDAGLHAWAKVDRAIRTVGTHSSVVFDDALIHRVITEMGGWVELGRKEEKEWPFLRNEFVNRYRGYRMRSERPDYPAHLIGIAEAANAKGNFMVAPPLLLGDAKQAQLVALGGTDKPLLQVTTAAQLAAQEVAALPAPERKSNIKKLR